VKTNKHFLALVEFLAKVAEQEVGNLSTLSRIISLKVCSVLWVFFITGCFNHREAVPARLWGCQRWRGLKRCSSAVSAPANIYTLI